MVSISLSICSIIGAIAKTFFICLEYCPASGSATAPPVVMCSSTLTSRNSFQPTLPWLGILRLFLGQGLGLAAAGFLSYFPGLDWLRAKGNKAHKILPIAVLQCIPCRGLQWSRSQLPGIPACWGPTTEAPAYPLQPAGHQGWSESRMVTDTACKAKNKPSGEPHLSEGQPLDNFPPGVTRVYLSLSLSSRHREKPPVRKLLRQNMKKRPQPSPYNFPLTLNFGTQYFFSNGQEGDLAC